MRLKSIELSGFKSFAKKTTLSFDTAITAIVGPNGSGKSNIAESFRFALGEQSMKSMRGKRGEDMVWNGSAAVPRAGRASVKLVLDNGDRSLSLDFDEVSVERSVARDGNNEYRLNASAVRLRDISELLAQANIGASGHHIISQGEADRILSASSRDRREMIEDALGLTQFLYKREDAERKLEKTAENVREVEGLRRELSPHLKFLEKQVKKIEEGEELRQQLANAYLEYLSREHTYLKHSVAHIEKEVSAPTHERAELDHKVEKLRAALSKKGAGDASTHELIRLEKEGSAARAKRETLTRELGRIEGELEAFKKFTPSAEGGVIPAKEALAFAEELAAALDAALAGDISGLKDVAATLARKARAFSARITEQFGGKQQALSEDDIRARKSTLEKELREVQGHEEKITADVAELRRTIESEKDLSRDAERELFSAMARRSELEALISSNASRRAELAREEESFKTEVAEGKVLVGEQNLAYEHHRVGDSVEQILAESRDKQYDRRRKLERMKIRLEEIGAGNSSEILKEHKETRDRDEFLAKELQDLAQSAESLKKLIGDLTQTLEVRFGDGIKTISAQFDEFFKIMFGGGTASLSLVKERKIRRGAGLDEGEDENDAEEEEVEEGVEIAISLPHKRVKSLDMLSGGERALTSIALIFAMSQVNPPPFLILDETDAALDEANSRRYGDMIERLAKRSQLILITHNRETMSRAGILYGVTMGNDGVSKLLSVRFEEAVAVAK